MAIYTATFAGVAVTAAQDVFEIVAPSNSRVKILDCKLGQYTDFGDAAAEILSIQVIRGYTTSGSGGASVTPSNLEAHSGALSAGSTVERNNTTVAQDGTGAVLVADAFNIAAGWALGDVFRRRGFVTGKGVDDYSIWVDASQRLVFRITAPADSLTMNGTLIFEEVGS